MKLEEIVERARIVTTGVASVALALASLSSPAISNTEKPNIAGYGALDRHMLQTVRYVSDSSKRRFLVAMERMRKYNLEPIIERYSERFGIDKSYVIPVLINESGMSINCPSTRGGCTGIGQVTKDAVRFVNKAFGTSFKHTNNPRYIKDQIGAAVGYSSLKVNQRREYGIDDDTAAKLAYFAYNAGGAPVDLVIRDLQKNGLGVTWENIEARITPSLLRRSSAFYRRWSPSALKNKAEIIKRYVRNAETYRSYLGQLEF